MWETDSEEEIANQYFFTKNFRRHLGANCTQQHHRGEYPLLARKIKIYFIFLYFSFEILKI